MTLQEFIILKEEELKQLGKYKDVKFNKATDVGLSKNCTSDNFLVTHSDLSKNIQEVVDFSMLPERSITETNDNGSQVQFEVKKPRKRKYESLSLYVLYV